MVTCSEEWVSRAEAARFLGESLYGFDRLVREGRIVPQRVPGRACPRYLRADVEALPSDSRPSQPTRARRVGNTVDAPQVEFSWTSINERGEAYTCEFVGYGQMTLIGPAPNGGDE